MIVYVVQMELVEQKPNKTDPFKYVLGVYTDPEEAKQAGTIEPFSGSALLFFPA